VISVFTDKAGYVSILKDIRKDWHVQTVQRTYRNQRVRLIPTFLVDVESFLIQSRLLQVDRNLRGLAEAECRREFEKSLKWEKASLDPEIFQIDY
jgi:hypothetical protein